MIRSCTAEFDSDDRQGGDLLVANESARVQTGSRPGRMLAGAADAEAAMLLADALAHQGSLDEAIAELRFAIRLKPYDPVAHNRLGDFLARRGRIDDANAEYFEAKRLGPDRKWIFNLEALNKLNVKTTTHTNGKPTTKSAIQEATSPSKAEVRASFFKASGNLFLPEPVIAPLPLKPPIGAIFSRDRTMRSFANDDDI